VQLAPEQWIHAHDVGMQQLLCCVHHCAFLTLMQEGLSAETTAAEQLVW